MKKREIPDSVRERLGLESVNTLNRPIEAEAKVEKPSSVQIEANQLVKETPQIGPDSLLDPPKRKINNFFDCIDPEQQKREQIEI